MTHQEPRDRDATMEAQAEALERFERIQDEQRQLQIQQQIASDQQMAEEVQYGRAGYVASKLQ